MPVPVEILALVEKFREHIGDYKSGRYNETQVRREFVDPFFKALGWDVDNTASYAEGYKDVVHEDAIKIGGSTKAPDYSFRIGGVRKFFVETKKPSVNVKGDPVPAYQLRRYAWSAKLPLSIVTDFEELAVYDCRTRPQQNDKASKDRTLYLTFDQYEQRWDEIAGIFSRESILRGSFDKYAASKKKRGTAEVDDEFLKEIERWRETLAKNLALRNKQLSQRELNFAVQRTIDRIIFLRICEDRGIEPIDQLRGVTNGRAIYRRLGELFRQADAKYNSGLFHFERERGRADDPDELSLSLDIDDKVLVDIIRHLYYPECPYEFSVLPADILGQVYERFLGKVIRLTQAHQAKVEEKPEVRKAGGVYYTPTYIVDYIVQNTVGKLLEGKTPQEISGRTKTFQPAKGKRPLSVLDPACGSGSFLIGAYQHLLDWHLKWYSEHEPETYCKGKEPRIYEVTGEAASGGYRLTTAEKKRILLDHIYGVDIDPQAVEVTKLSLLLKVLEGETRETLQRQLFAKERALPDLAGNIKCGNSLIGPDFWQNQQMDLFDEEERLRINTFDWQAEFPQIFEGENPGFDAVIGNPPWGGDIDSHLAYYSKTYPNSTRGYKDTAKLFIDKSIRLTQSSKMASLIVPSAMMFQPRWQDVRELLRTTTLETLWNVGDRVFGAGVAAPCCVFTASRIPPPDEHEVSVVDTFLLKDNVQREAFVRESTPRRLLQSTYAKTTQNVFVTFFRELQANEVHLENVLECKDCGIKHQRVGCGMEAKGKSDLAKRLYYEGVMQDNGDHQYLIGADLQREGWFVDTSNHRYFRGSYDSILKRNEIVYFNESVFELPEKIVWRQTSDRIRATIIGPGWFANTLQAGILLDQRYNLRYILGILNSKFLNFVYVENVKELGRVFPQVKLGKLRTLPFRTIDFSNRGDIALHDQLVNHVTRIMALYKSVHEARIPGDKTTLIRQITATDAEIDRLVYELYGLTDDEICLVEEATQ